MVTADFQFSRSCTIMLRCLVLLLIFGISSSSAVINLPLGSQFKLQCSHPDDGLLSPEYLWSFAHPDEKNAFSPLSEMGEEHELNPVETHHNGTFRCVIQGFSETGAMKIMKTFEIQVTEIIPVIMWPFLERTEGESVTLPCTFTPETINSYRSVHVKWFKVKDLQNRKEDQELTPVVRSKSFTEKKESENERETQARTVYWTSDLQDLDHSIDFDNLKVDDASLYRCVIMTAVKEERLFELVVKPIPPPRCFNQSHPWEACPDPEGRSGEAILQESLTEFSFNLYKYLNSMKPESNLLFSPISISMLVSHLLLGSRGETRTDLERTLSLPLGFSCIHSEMKKLRSKMKESILITNQMFYHRELKLREAFVNQTQEFYDFTPQKLTSDSEANVRMINNWVSSQTENRIPELVDFFDESTEFVLLNAVYFMGQWEKAFDKREDEFTTFSGDVVSVPTLYKSNYNLVTDYIKELKAHVGKFTLTEKNSLYVLLPSSAHKQGLEATEAALTDNNIRVMVKELASAEPAPFEVSLPKVKLLLNTDLHRLLSELGVRGLFDDPNLCGMFDQDSTTALTDARHRAFLSLTEKGVEAAAASTVTFSRSFSNFNAMRPFLLIVWNEEINSPLFIGKVLHPKENE
ncbi:plasma protease C1 inhibitor isoform 1-T1 [Clarias gariepinus]